MSNYDKRAASTLKEGIYSGFFRFFAVAFFILAVLSILGDLISLTPLSRDDSDPGTWGARSGMAVYVDHKTGCEYLSAGGGFGPRLDSTGHQVCEEAK